MAAPIHTNAYYANVTTVIDDSEMLRLMVWNPAEFTNYRGGTADWALSVIDREPAGRSVGSRTAPMTPRSSPS